eukprot:TRINITY_DN1703_c0_g1_i1.p1 TRINITY_DN1703_c0_g1~~TRINITY_DN1703_c0_g1_i1.p1  ORF type:complete len:482 (-),score=104.18 TRINITY_DN1703_c0_g1_i1:670-2079(-)
MATSTPTKVGVIIIGAGPTGLGAAWRLNDIKHPSWLVLEGATDAGGLASTVVDPQGFTWDLGVHQIFSHYDYFDKVMDTALPREEEWAHHKRAAFIWMRDRFVPYPLQNNTWQLPQEDVIKVVDGLLELHNKPLPPTAANFEDWMQQRFGKGLCEIFMVPYNRKVWAIEPSGMCTEWMGERVSVVQLKGVLHNMITQKVDAGWGPNATFRYPLHGGTGGIWKRVAECLPQENFRYNSNVVKINSTDKIVELADGSRFQYDRLITTMAIDHLLNALTDQPQLLPYAPQMRYSAVHLCNVGFEGPCPERLVGKYWMYFPEDLTPMFRCTVFSNYAPSHVPKPGQQWSLLCEVSESVDKPVNHDTIMDEVIQGLKNVKMIDDSTVIATKWHCRLDHGYPTPFYGRDPIVHDIDRQLKPLGIWTRGRFGGWKYEVSNQDHSFMQGVEAVDAVVEGREELTFYKADLVNSTRTR